MRVTYTTTFVGICPVDGTLDVYELTVQCDDNYPYVEDILKAIGQVTQLPGTQEEITQDIKRRLPTAILVKTTGIHSGIRTEVEV